MASEDHQVTGEVIGQLLGDALAYLYPAALRVAARTGLADLMADGPVPASRLAAQTGADEDQLRRILRFLATRGVFREEADGAFGLTAAASLLRSDSPKSLKPLVLLFTDPMYWLPAGRLDETLRKGSTVFADIFSAQIFEYLAASPEPDELFADAMAALSMIEQGGVVASYDFPATGTVADIGGGLGTTLRAVLVRNPGLSGILFDRERVLARHRLGEPGEPGEPAIGGRWTTVAGDFYAEVPSGADIYLLKRILHDKTDADCLRVLRACRSAMPETGRVLIIDPLLPEGPGYPASLKRSDVLMMAVFEGKERTERELRVLLDQAGLGLSQVIATPTSLTVVEAVAS